MEEYNIYARLSYKRNTKILLTKELYTLKEKGLKLDENNIVELTKENSILIENEIKNDYDYIPFAKIVYNSLGKENIINKDKFSLIALIREIDRDNSTNVWRYRKKDRPIEENGIIRITDYIIANNTFFERLEKGDIYLIDEIIDYCGKEVTSLSSKICKYLSEYLYEKDNYYINDKYIRCALPFYLDKYNLTFYGKKTDLYYANMSYVSLFNYLESIKNKLNNGLSRSNIDHIIWYSYKSYNKTEKKK